jgi:hypothetical protein
MVMRSPLVRPHQLSQRGHPIFTSEEGCNEYTQGKDFCQ